MKPFQKVYEIVKLIPSGKVATYGQIARIIGNPRASQMVGFALHVNPEPDIIPCHRVVNRFGEPSTAFAFGGLNRQVVLLEGEGIHFVDGRVPLADYQWTGDDCKWLDPLSGGLS